MKIAGYLLVAFGLLDLVLSFMGTDMWGEMGIIIPEPFWQYTTVIELGLGFLLIKFGSAGDAEEEAEGE